MDPAMVKNLALGAIPPAFIAAVYFVALWLKRSPVMHADGSAIRAERRILLVPVVMTCAMVFTFMAVFGMPTLAPVTAFDWLPLIGVAAGFAGVIASLEGIPSFVRWTPAVGAMLFAAWASAKNPIASSWPAEQSAAYLLESMLMGVVVLAGANWLASRRPGLAPVLVLMLFAGAVTQLLVLGYFSMKVGQVAGMGASMLIAAAGVALWRKEFRLGPGGVTFIVVVTMAALGQGKLYGQASPELARVYAALAVLSVVGAALVGWGLSTKVGPRMRGAIVVVVAALPLLAGLGVAGKKWAAEQEAASESEYGY